MMSHHSQTYLNLLRELVSSQFKLRDQNSLLGLVWSFLNPLAMLGILFVVFRTRVSEGIENYAIYLLIGIVIYTHFANSTAAAMQVFQHMRSLTADAIFPKEILVLATVLSRSVEFAISSAICIVIAFLAGIDLTWSVLLIAAVILVQTAFVLAISLVLSFVYLYLKDIEHLYQVLLKMLFFLTPIFYDMEFLGDGIVRTIVLMNPLTHLTMFARAAIMGGDALLPQFLAFVVTTLALLGVSFALFKRFEPALAERV